MIANENQTDVSEEEIAENALKLKFADAILRNPNNPWQAAQKVFPGIINHERCNEAAHHWAGDPVVLHFKERLVDEYGPREFLPTREEAAREIYERAQKAPKMDDFNKGMKLYCDVMGFIEKPGVNVTNNNSIVQNVLRVPYVQDEGEWEKIAVDQQENLLKLTVDGQAKEAARDKAKVPG